MRDKDVFNCLSIGAVIAIPGPMMDAFVWIPFICNADASTAAKR